MFLIVGRYYTRRVWQNTFKIQNTLYFHKKYFKYIFMKYLLLNFSKSYIKYTFQNTFIILLYIFGKTYISVWMFFVFLYIGILYILWNLNILTILLVIRIKTQSDSIIYSYINLLLSFFKNYFSSKYLKNFIKYYTYTFYIK